MGKNYFKTKATKKVMSDFVSDKALGLFGDFNMFRKTKVLTMNTYLMKNGTLYQMNNPFKCSETLLGETFLRCYSSCMVTTLNHLR